MTKLANFQSFRKAALQSLNMASQPTSKTSTFDFKFDVASIFNYSSWINVSKLAEIARINASLMRPYKSGMPYISEAQLTKIEEALHRIGHEISGIKLTGS